MSTNLSAPASMYVTNTILGIENQQNLKKGSAIEYHHQMALNAKYGVLDNIDPLGALSLGYFSIGNGGTYYSSAAGVTRPHNPSNRNADLFSPLPFRCIPADEDHLMPVVERAKYRMRALREYGGIQYWCYFLKKIDFTGSDTEILIIDPSNGSASVYQHDDAFLNPTPTIPQVGGVTDAGEKIIVSTTADVTVTYEEISEAIDIIHNGDYGKAMINEWGFFTGLDKAHTADDGNGSTVAYTEASYATLATIRTDIGKSLISAGEAATATISFENGSTFNQ